MANVFYTTTEAVRAALGVTDKEVEDSQMADLGLEVQLELETDIVYPAHVALKTAIDNLTATAEEIKVWKTLQLFCQYQAAVFMLPGIQNLIPQKLTDGDFEMQRFIKDSLKDTENKIIELRDKYRGLLNSTSFSVTALIHNPLMLSTPTYDPVTGEG